MKSATHSVATVVGWRDGKATPLGWLARCVDWFMAMSSAGSDWMPMHGPGGRCLGAADDPSVAAKMVVDRWSVCGYA